MWRDSRANVPSSSLKNAGVTNLSNIGGVPRPSASGGVSNSSDGQYRLDQRSSLPPERIVGSKASHGKLPQPREQGHAGGYYGLCRSLVIQVLANGTGKKLATELKDDDAQCMADFLSEVLDDKHYSLSQHERKHTLHLLVKIAKSAQVFPQTLELQSVQCDLSRHITGGAFGLIYKGVYEGKSACVKAVHIQEGGFDKSKIRAHAGELILSAHLSHQNVLPFSGIYFSDESPPRVCIVSPWMDNGDLLRYIKAHPNVPPIPIIRDIISGLKYLHDFDIVHADLKARNILISATHRAMLADFGISRVVMTAGTTTAEVATGTAYWMAPELFLEDDPTPTRESDIWAFGCVCYEIITGMMPFYQFKLVPHLINAFLKGSPLPQKPTQDEGWYRTKEKVWSMAEGCWKREPQTRPNAGKLEILIAGLDFSDNRPPESEYSRPKPNGKVDYSRIFEILYPIRNSPSASSGTFSKDRGAAFEEELMQQLMEAWRQERDLRVRVETLEKDNKTLNDKLIAFQRGGGEAEQKGRDDTERRAYAQATLRNREEEELWARLQERRVKTKAGRKPQGRD